MTAPPPTDIASQVVSDDVPAHYSAALDEIYRLRTALAYEAGVIEGHLELATFPKSRRDFASEQVRRMRTSARGNTDWAYADIASWALESARTNASMELLTRSTWEASR